MAQADLKISRRSVLATMAAAAALPRLALADEASPVATGALASNKLAQAFEPAPDSLPGVSITGPNGDRAILEIVKGRTVFMPLWAEWCAPCLIELSDFSRLQEVYGNEKFAIIPVLTGTSRKFTPDTLAQFLKVVNAPNFEPLMEADYGSRLARTMARKGRVYTLPCNLLIAPSGRVIGREMTLRVNDADGAPPKTNGERLDQALAGNTQSLWGTKDGDDFATCLANGFVKFQ